jgi:hypothetical protein
VNKGVSKVEAILKTVMSPTEPLEAYVENYLLLVADKNLNNFTKLLELKGIRKPDQGPLVDMFHKRISHHDHLVDNSNVLPQEVFLPTTSTTVPSSITTSLSTMASTAASNFNNTRTNSPTTSPSSPTEVRGRLNENFRKLVMTGMAFRKDLQERRGDQS